MDNLIKNNRFLIKTTEGYKSFAGLAESKHKSYLSITFENNSLVKCSKNHIFWTSNNELIKAGDLTVGLKLKAENNILEISTINEISSKTQMIDIIEVESTDNNFLLSNKIKSHNCQFLTFEKTLIETDILDFYQTPGVIEEVMGFEIYKDKLDHIDSLLIITIDPSAGGEDSSVLHLWEIAPQQVFQVGSIVDPDMDASLIFEKILWLQQFMQQRWNYLPDESLLIFERNGIGEGLAQILTQTEKAIENLEIPIFYDGKGAGLHLNPTMKSKLALQFKNLLEYNKLIINDEKFIDELYGFIRTGNGTYSGKSGYHDDRVMCAFQIVYYLMNVFADFAQGDFSVDNMMLVKPEDKIINIDKEELDPAEQHRKRMAAEALEKEKSEEEKKAEELKIIEEAKKLEREMYAKQAAMGSSIIEDDDDDDLDLDEYDILPSVF